MNDVSDRDELLEILNMQFPGLEDSKFAIAIDKKVVVQNTSLADGCIVALLPPFSGG